MFQMYKKKAGKVNYKKRKFFSDCSSWHSIENEENSDESGSENFDINLEL